MTTMEARASAALEASGLTIKVYVQKDDKILYCVEREDDLIPFLLGYLSAKNEVQGKEEPR